MRSAGLIKRLALLPLGVLLGLLVLEGMLQIGALAVRLSGQQLPSTWLGTKTRILCVGDSNTYGLYLADRSLAYPQQLERLWNESGSDAGVEVLNLGYPGTNSSRLRRDLPRMLETLRPDMVIIMVGSNDYWTAPVEPAAAADGEGLGARLRRWSRVYQLTYMLRRALDQRQLEVVYQPKQDGGQDGVARYGGVEFELGFRKANRQPDHDARLDENLRHLAETARAAGVEPVFMTYPSKMWNYGDASRLIRIAAERSGTRLVDLAPVFEPLCPTEPCPEWLYPDHHATAKGYRTVAETLLRHFKKPPP